MKKISKIGGILAFALVFALTALPASAISTDTSEAEDGPDIVPIQPFAEDSEYQDIVPTAEDMEPYNEYDKSSLARGEDETAITATGDTTEKDNTWIWIATGAGAVVVLLAVILVATKAKKRAKK